MGDATYGLIAIGCHRNPAVPGQLMQARIAHMHCERRVAQAMSGMHSRPILFHLDEVTVQRRYEVQGEYVIPSSAAIPSSAVSMALAPQAVPRTLGLSPHAQAAARRFETPSTGRWRLQVRPQKIARSLMYLYLQEVLWVIANVGSNWAHTRP